MVAQLKFAIKNLDFEKGSKLILKVNNISQRRKLKRKEKRLAMHLSKKLKDI